MDRPLLGTARFILNLNPGPNSKVLTPFFMEPLTVYIARILTSQMLNQTRTLVISVLIIYL